MIDFLFTIDYEIFGNGSGSLAEHVHEPAKQLLKIFREWDAKIVLFVEPLELQKIEEHGTDAAIAKVRQQVRDAFEQGFEIGLHLHPQWSRAVYRDGGWVLDYSEYNLCRLESERIEEIFDQAIEYLRGILTCRPFAPVSFRAGNWLFQPTARAAKVLCENGVRVDSSVFRGGVQRTHGLDYRGAPHGAYYWRFREDVIQPEPTGPLVEIPIHTRMVPSWRMVTAKRIRSQQQKGHSPARTVPQRLNRLRDRLRLRYPLKLDFCRMTLRELTTTMDAILAADRANPDSYKPIVAIGHTKDLVDFDTVEGFLDYLETKQIPTADFQGALDRLTPQPCPVSAVQTT